MHFTKALLAVAATASLVACANRPESIHASYVSYEKFMDSECAGLSSMLADTRSELDKFSELQNSKATGDAIGVFLLGVPFSKLSGDHEADVARLKGEVEAIETAQVKKRCKGNTASQTVQTAPTLSVSDIEKKIDLLNELRAKGIISDEEYKTKRAQLLDTALLQASTTAPSATSPSGQHLPVAAVENGLLAGDRLVFEETNTITGVMIKQAIFSLDAITQERISMNSGTIVMASDGSPIKGQIASAVVYGYKREGRSTRGMFRVPQTSPDVEVSLTHIGTSELTVSGRNIPVTRYRISGFSSHPVSAGISGLGSSLNTVGGGSRIAGEMLVDGSSGIVVQLRTASNDLRYDISWKLVTITK